MWIVVPSLFFGVITQRLVPTIVVVAIGGALAFAQRRTELPLTLRRYLPALQPAVVFLFLGSNPVALVAVVFIFAMIFAQASRIVPAMRRWWDVQARIPMLVRRTLALAIPFVVGFMLGAARGGEGNPWTTMLMSVGVGTLAAFLLTFTPPTQRVRHTTTEPA